MQPLLRRSTLPHGLRVVTEQTPGARAFNVGFFVAVGSRDESRELHGASHFLEYVLFKGTPTRDAEQISASIEAQGGDLNAYTTREYTCFHMRVLTEQAELAVDVLSDMLANSLIRPADFGIEREVILDEIAMHDDDQGEVAIEAAIAGLFADSELARTVIGSSTSIGRQSARRVRDYWRRGYTSDRIVVSAVGDVDHDALCATLSAFDAALQPGEGSTPMCRRTALASTRPRVTRSTTDLAQTTVVLAFDGMAALDPRREALALLAVALGGGMSSRLFLEVRERRALAYTIDCSESAWSDAGIFTIDWQALPERTAEIMDVVQRIVADVRRDGITAIELEAAVGQLVGQTILHFENPSARMSRLGSGELLGDRRTLDDIVTAYRAVTLDDVNTLAREVLAPVPVVALAGASVSRSLAEGLQKHWLI